MTKESFNLFLNNSRQLELIRVVDHLVCGQNPVVVGAKPSAEKLRELLHESFRLAAQCTNYMHPNETKVVVGISDTVANLKDISIVLGAEVLVLPSSRYIYINSVFRDVAKGLNAIVGENVVKISRQSYLPFLSYRGQYDDKTPQSMLSENVRGVWDFQEHREVA